MDERALKKLLKEVKRGKRSTAKALKDLRTLPFKDFGFAKLDFHRPLRKGFPEVIFCPGKTKPQIVKIFRELSKKHDTVLATKAEREVFVRVKEVCPDAVYHEEARLIVFQKGKRKDSKRKKSGIVVLTAGTSDIPVAEEAAVTCEIMGCGATRIYDVGVAGIHRLMGNMKQLSRAKCIIVAAGMEGALASVVGGLVSCPVIAVPTSVGYGANFHGLAALLAMLNSCAPGISVVNIDNGFGAGYFAAMLIGVTN